MSRARGERIRRQLDEAEGYLDLDLPWHSLQILESRTKWPSLQFEACLIQGEALRRLNRFREAIVPLETALSLRPGDMGVALALAWCYKRTNRLAQAIDSLEGARKNYPESALLAYNLACYWSLAGNLGRAMIELNLSLKLEPELRNRLADETDFHPLRGHPDFDRLLSSSLPSKGKP
jgi:tetratricopeptide (TPR) repeat protein